MNEHDANDAARHLIRQLERSLDRHQASGDAFVASVYGEWGVGKTHCLKAVEAHFAAQRDAALQPGQPQPNQWVLPVMFVPWRYEHEEHLVVPLLKTIELAIKDVLSEVEKAQRDGGLTVAFVEGVTDGLTRGWKSVSGLARATASAVKFKATPLGVGLEFDGGAAIKHAQADEAKSPDGFSPAELTSLYFNAQYYLSKATEKRQIGEPGRKQELALRFVILVDDLDRCLPEKAIQVLESVKLFLNVPGFSFVLAVDDEVVERGIAHRYRDYRLTDKDGNAIGDLPISGTQYLEKIVHLPIHLPRWTRARAERFLLSEYPRLYAQQPATPRDDHAGKLEGLRPRGVPPGDAPPRANEVLLLLLDAVPLVPRKLIRLSEGLDYLQGVVQAVGHAAKWSALHGLRVVALQQLHPALYRHLREGLGLGRPGRYARLFGIDLDQWHEPRFRGTQDGLDALRVAARNRKSEGSDAATEQAETLREKLDLLERLHHCAQQRGAGQPLLLFANAKDGDTPAGLSLEHFLQLYFHHEPLPEPPASPPPGAQLPMADLPDANAAVSALLNPDAISRREFIQGRELEGRQLPEPVFAQLLPALEASSMRDTLVLDMDWLKDMAAITSPEQLLRLYAGAQLLQRWNEACRA